MGIPAKKAVAIPLSLTLLSALPALAAECNSADLYEPYNHLVSNINDKADHYVLAPVARGYRKVTPKPVRAGVSNFFNNLCGAVSFGSNVLQLDDRRVNEDLVRVGTNTTFGLGGLIDVAGAGGIPNNKNTLDDTFASWGQKNSNCFAVPLLRPFTAHDATGSIITTVYPVKNAVFHTSAGCQSNIGLNAVNNREGLLNLTDSLEGAASDKYSYTRDLYMRMRVRQTGGTSPQTPDDDIDTDELVDNGKPSNPSPAGTVDTPQTASVPVAGEWVRIRPEGGSNAGQVQ